MQQDLDIQEYTDPEHDPMIPHTLVLKPGLVVHSVYNGYWFWGRPSFYDLWHDLRVASQRDPPGLGPEQPGAPRRRGKRATISNFHGWNRQSPGAMPTSYVELEQERRMTLVRTPVCELLGIEQPIVQAPMSAVPELAAAVSNAGGLGMLALTWSDSPAGSGPRDGRAHPTARSAAIWSSTPTSTIASTRP